MPAETVAGFPPREGSDVVFIEDGAAVQWGELCRDARALAGRLAEQGVVRLAVYSGRPSVLGRCLLACTEAKRDLVILRYDYPPDSPFWGDVGVDAVAVEGDLSLRMTGTVAPPPADAPGILIPTSGTSGTPKIARHLLPSLLGRIRAARAAKGQARWLLTYQPSGFAGIQIVLTALATGSVLVSIGEIDVPRLARTAVEQQVTHISGTPTFWRSFLLCLGKEAAALPLEQITLGGELVDQATLDRLRAVYPSAACSHIYASTEAGSLFSVRDGRAGFPAAWLSQPIDGVGLRIREGILEVRSPRAMTGYLNSANRPWADDGWLITGDRVAQQGDRVFFLGREDSVINIGGGKVTPEEVEAALLDVAGVRDLRAFAARNPITGFVIGLEVAPAEGVDTEALRQDILAAARQKLASYKVPRLIRFVDAVRSDPSGKKSRSSE